MSAFGALEAARPPVGQHLTNSLTSQMGKQSSKRSDWPLWGHHLYSLRQGCERWLLFTRRTIKSQRRKAVPEAAQQVPGSEGSAPTPCCSPSGT